MARLNKRLFTHKQIEEEVSKLGREYPSLFTLNFIVYYKNGTSPVKTAKTTSVSSYNRSIENGELEDGRYSLDKDEKFVIASKITFGEFIEIYLDDKVNFQNEYYIRSMSYHELIDWVWFGKPDGRGKLKPLNNTQKKQVLKSFHKYANEKGNTEIEFVDYNLRKNKLI